MLHRPDAVYPFCFPTVNLLVPTDDSGRFLTLDSLEAIAIRMLLSDKMITI